MFAPLSGRDSADASTRCWRRSAWPTAGDRLAGILSHGETQWLEIGMVLMQDPRLLLLDEPVAGMTEAEIEKTVELSSRA